MKRVRSRKKTSVRNGEGEEVEGEDRRGSEENVKA